MTSILKNSLKNKKDGIVIVADCCRRLGISRSTWHNRVRGMGVIVKREPPDNILGCLIWIMLLIPVGIYYLLKWTVTGVICLCSLIVRAIRTIVCAIRTKEKNSYKYEKVMGADFSKIDCMDGHDFEHFVADVLKHNDYQKVAVTKGSGDFGVDIVAKKGKSRWAFQCKCYQSKLGVKPVQEVYGGLKKYNAQIGVVVTNTYFTPHAKELANSLGILLWDRDKLAALMAVSNSESNLSTPKASAPIEDSAISSQPEPLPKQTTTTLLEEFSVATIIGAGKYVFGEDLPLGKYDLRVISGTGLLKIQTEEDDESWVSLGQDTRSAKDYHGLSLPQGWYFSLDGNLQVEITKSKMLKIE